MEVVKGYETVNLPHYERHEMESCLEYYSEKRWLTKGNQDGAPDDPGRI